MLYRIVWLICWVCIFTTMDRVIEVENVHIYATAGAIMGFLLQSLGRRKE